MSGDTLRILNAVEHVRALPGGSRPHLMRADDGLYYVVKFLNNPQHPRVLINEWLAAELAGRAGMPVPQTTLVRVSRALVEGSPGLRMPFGSLTLMCSVGIQFGSRLCGEAGRSVLFDFLPSVAGSLLRNPEAIVGAWVFDRWVANADRRQFVYVRTVGQRGIKAWLIDNGLCFGGGQWRFEVGNWGGVARLEDFCGDFRGRARDWDSFGHWVGEIERLDLSELRARAHLLPASWNGDVAALDRLFGELDRRRRELRFRLGKEIATACEAMRHRQFCPRLGPSSTGSPRPFADSTGSRRGRRNRA